MTVNAKLETLSKSEQSNARYEILKNKSNKELHILMQTALNNRKVQTGIHRICLLTDGQNEMRFSFLCFLLKREHFWQKKLFLIFWGQKPHFLFLKITDFWNSIKTSFYIFNSQHYRNEMHFPKKVNRKSRLALKKRHGFFNTDLEHFILGGCHTQHCSAQLLFLVKMSNFA